VNSVALKIKDLKKVLNFSWERSLLVGEVLYQQPLEAGVPISILTNGVVMSKAQAKTTGDLKGTTYSIEMDSQLQ